MSSSSSTNETSSLPHCDEKTCKRAITLFSDILSEYWYVVIMYFLLSFVYVIETYLSRYIGFLVGTEKERKLAIRRITQILCFSLICRGMLYIIDGNFLPFMEKLIRINIMERDLYQEMDVGVSLKDAMEIPEQIKFFFEIIRYTIIPTLFSQISTVYLIWQISPRIAIIGLVVFFFVLCLCVFNVVGMNKFFSGYEIRAADAVSRNHADVIRNRKNVIHYNQYDNELKHNNYLNIKYNTYHRGRFLFNYSGKTLIIGLSYLNLLLGILIAFKLLVKGKIKTKDITTIALLLQRFVELNGRYIISIGEFAHLLKTLNFKKCYNYISFNFFGYNQKERPLALQRAFTPIKFREAVIKRGAFKLYLHNLTISHYFTCISGLSGSGKTTLVSCLLKTVPDYDGSIIIFGRELRNFTFQEINSMVAYLPQSPILFNRTIFDNIQYFDETITRERVEKLLIDLKVTNVTSKILDRVVTPQNDNVSGGQMQIICMLRAVLREKQLIIMDEPTSALDPRNTQYVIDMILRVREKTRVLVVSHDDRVIKQADHNIQLDAGRLLGSTFKSSSK